MKTICNLIVVTIFCSMVLASCNGKNGNATETKIEEVAEQQDNVTEQENNVTETKDNDEATNDKVMEWDGASSRSDLKSKLDGTVWETTKPYSVTGLYYRFKINGNSVYWYSAAPTHNYDDAKNWSDCFNLKIDEIAEPEAGLYCVICKAVNDDDARAAVPTILVFQGKTVRYSLGGDMGPTMKLVER